MNAKKKTRLEGKQTGCHYQVREIFVDSGKCFRILLDWMADDELSAKAELRGALKFYEGRFARQAKKDLRQQLEIAGAQICPDI